MGKLGVLPDSPLEMGDVTTAYKDPGVLGAVNGGNTPPDHVGTVYSGVFFSPDLLTGTAGTFNPDPTKAQQMPISFVVAVPDPATVTFPATGWPVVLYGHGLGGSRNDLVDVAEAVNKAGFILIAADAPFHGSRTSCTGSKAVTASKIPPGAQPSDDWACKAPAQAPINGNMACDEGVLQGLCVLSGAGITRDPCAPTIVDASGDTVCAPLGEGRCAADHKCQGLITANGTVDCSGGGDAQCAGAGLGLCHPTSKKCTGSPADFGRSSANAVTGDEKISGWNIFSPTNFFATRDNFRQQVIDLSQLVRLVKSTANTSVNAKLGGTTNAPKIDATKIHYLGQSLGGILGTLFNAVSPDTTHVALNVPGGGLVKLVFDSPTLAPSKAALVSTLAAGGINPGTPAFDQFLGTAQWILDEADPVNMGYRLTHPADTGSGSSPNANRKVFIQFIQDDQYVINESNLALVAGANRNFTEAPPSFGCTAPLFCYQFTQAGDGFDQTSLPLASRHGFLRNFTNAAVTTKAQTQITQFLLNGTGP
jgi:hypothetical protein